MTLITEAEIIAGEAYQVIGALSHYANMFDHPEVQRALDWFSGFEPGITYKDDASILPWPKEELKPDDGWLPIDSAPKDGTPIIGAFFSIRWADSHKKHDIVRCWFQPEFDAFISSCSQMVLADGYTFDDGTTKSLHHPVIEPVTHWIPIPPAPSSKDNESAI